MLPKQPNKSLIDGISCLQGVVSRTEHVGVSELAKMLDMEQTKVHRLLRTLAHLGFTQQNRSRKYGPGPAIYALAAQTLYASHFIRDALGPLEELRARLPHIVAMGVVWNRRVNYLYHAKRGTPLEQAIGTFGNWLAAAFGNRLLNAPVLASDRGMTKMTARFKMMNRSASVISTAHRPPIIV